MGQIRLDKFLCEAIGCTRKEAKKLVSDGRILVENILCRSADTKIEETAQVKLDGRALSREKFVYLMLNKPKGIVSASRDARDRTVADLVKGDYPRRVLFPAGRLDKDSVGLILLTDDGALAHDLLSPRHHVSKTYLVEVDTPLTEEMEQGFSQGVTLADGQTMLPAKLERLGETIARVTLSQGVYHQIKRMFGVYHAGVVSLKRIAIGGVLLDASLQEGHYRPLTAQELQILHGK